MGCGQAHAIKYDVVLLSLLLENIVDSKKKGFEDRCA